MDIPPPIEEFVSAFTARDEEQVIATFHGAVELEAPLPLGKRKGDTRAAESLLKVAKLGIAIRTPSVEDKCHQLFVKSPAGHMVLRSSLDSQRVTRPTVAKG
jgi:hypothetical protein